MNHKTSRIIPIFLCLIMLLTPAALANGTTVGQVNLHVGMNNTLSLTYTTADPTPSQVVVTPNGSTLGTTYPVTSSHSKDAGKLIHVAVLTDLIPGMNYTYDIGPGLFRGQFTAAKTDGAFTFAYLTDPQIGFASDAKSVGATFRRLDLYDPLAFAFIAGDITDGRKETQWEQLFSNGGVYSGAGQQFFAKNLLAVAQGNHDHATFNGHISVPSAGTAVGEAVYAFDYSNLKFIVLNLNHPKTQDAQAAFLKTEVAKAKAKGQWVFVGFHQSLYSGGTHIMDAPMIAARKFWSPLFAQLGVDVVLQGHDHVYSRGFVTAQGQNANLPEINGAYHSTPGAPLYMTGGHAGAVKWYPAISYKISKTDPIAPNYRFLSVNSAAPTQNVWHTATSQTKEQAYTVIAVNGDMISFHTYMFRYDGKQNKMTKQPYLYDCLALRRSASPF